VPPSILNEIRKNIPALVRWNRNNFEVPDVIGYADLQLCSDLFAADAASTSASYQPDKLLTFLYPNFHPDFPGKVRRFAVAQPVDQLILRYEVGRIVEKIDSIISDRVCSFRLDGNSRKYLPWAFKNSKESRQRLRDRSIEVLVPGAIRSCVGLT
jgi:hypothetical protein